MAERSNDKWGRMTIRSWFWSLGCFLIFLALIFTIDFSLYRINLSTVVSQSGSPHKDNLYREFLSIRHIKPQHSSIMSICKNIAGSLRTLPKSKSAVLLRYDWCGSRSFGNEMSDFYESLAISYANNVSFGSVPQVGHDCTSIMDGSRPDFFLPEEAAMLETNLGMSTLIHKINASCLATRDYAHEYQNAFMWKFPRLISDTNRAMFHAYTKKRDKSVPADASKTVAIHFRCSDNLVHGTYGVIPIPYVTKLLSSVNASKIVIFTDLRSSRVTEMDTFETKSIRVICEDYLENLIKELPNSIVDVDYDSSPEYIASYLFYARTTICSVSTFCFFSVIGGPGEKYFPETPLIGLSKSQHFENIYFFKTPLFLPDLSGIRKFHLQMNQVTDA